MCKKEKVWLLGATGFTGKYLLPRLQAKGYIVETQRVDITNAQAVEDAVLQIHPEYIINLAGVSFVPNGGDASIYAINTFGPENILKACLKLAKKPKKIILASSSHIYGEQAIEVIDETCLANPVNHYGCSKWAMEQIAKTYNNRLNILITRPFNYTGIGQTEEFLIPKIVSHFKKKEKAISLGNINIWRDFSDVRWIANIYSELLTIESEKKIFNLCSGQLTSLKEILEMSQKYSGYEIEVRVNAQFFRAADLQKQKGSNSRLLNELKSTVAPMHIKNTLHWMLDNHS